MANHYDKIFKENFDELLPYLLRELLGLELPKLEELKDKLQVTLEKEADIFKKVVHEDDPSKDYGLHCEVQLQDVDMCARELLYYGIFLQKYRMPLKQIVVYIGSAPGKLIKRNVMEMMGLRLEFTVIDLRSVSKDVFLQSGKPECVLLALLADYGQDKPEKVIRQILTNLTEIVPNKSRLKKYQQQLLVLSRLRSLTGITKNIITTMPLTLEFDIESDVLYKEGIEKGIEKGLEQGIEQGIEKGIEKGIEQGIEKGIEKGIEQGIEKGVEKGLEMGHQQALAVTRLLLAGQSITAISQKLNVSPDFVSLVARELGLNPQG